VTGILEKFKSTTGVQWSLKQAFLFKTVTKLRTQHNLGSLRQTYFRKKLARRVITYYYGDLKVKIIVC
jgi:hypothetical protein